MKDCYNHHLESRRDFFAEEGMEEAVAPTAASAQISFTTLSIAKRFQVFKDYFSDDIPHYRCIVISEYGR